ncbi:MAG: phosphopentomutase [Thermoanaerobaculia bacterium]|nr:phosphopentomutase [Thermoanaerobaculia bacterium]
MSKRRAIILVCDSLGVGELPDAAEFGDEGSDTLGHVLRDAEPKLPTLTRLGLLHTLATPPTGLPEPVAAWGKMAQRSAGKDTTTGHWEMMGLITDEPFRTYPEGFPPEVIEEFERRIGRKTLGNRPASGTVIIEELGREHIDTGKPIVYTSGDSVFQVAAHEDVIPIEELRRICEIARALMRGEHNVGRIIARPFVGEPGNLKRTANRKDFSVPPPSETYLDRIRRGGKRVAAIGKIADIFDRIGIDDEIRSESNSDGMRITTELTVRDDSADLIFTNLVDFDSKYGHRNDPAGYGRALETFDAELASFLEVLREDDLLFITADHGCDPSDESTDHTREYVPLIVAGPRIGHQISLGIRPLFADLGATVANYLGADRTGMPGESLLPRLEIS